MKGVAGVRGLARCRGVRGERSPWGRERVCRSLRGCRGGRAGGEGQEDAESSRGCRTYGELVGVWGRRREEKSKGWEGLGRRVGTSGFLNDREQERMRGCAVSRKWETGRREDAADQRGRSQGLLQEAGSSK